MEFEAGIQTLYGGCALASAIKTGNQELIDKLAAQEQELVDYDGNTMLMHAAIYQNITCVRKFIAQAGNQNHFGQTALMFAASNGFEAAISLLHAEIGLKDLRGQTALVYAVFQDHFEIIR